MGVVRVTWLFINFAVCRDAARRGGSPATAELLVWLYYYSTVYYSTVSWHWMSCDFFMYCYEIACLLTVVRCLLPLNSDWCCVTVCYWQSMWRLFVKANHIVVVGVPASPYSYDFLFFFFLSTLWCSHVSTNIKLVWCVTCRLIEVIRAVVVWKIVIQ